MPTRHGEKSCSHQVVHRHGARRRKCAECGKTWSVWKKRRGPKPHPRRSRNLRHTMIEGLTVKQSASRSHIPLETERARHRKRLVSLSSRPWPVVFPGGRLILLLDGLWFKFQGKRFVVYVMAVRSVRGNKAFFLRPIVCEGHESLREWLRVIQTIPAPVFRRICALVCDSFRGVNKIAGEQGWLVQRCHFHLLGRIANVFGTRKRTLAWMKGRRKAEEAIRELIATSSKKRVTSLRRNLRRMCRDSECPRKIRMIIREVLRRMDEFRTYLRHPELRLPSTSNVMENMNGRLRGMAGRSKGFRTAASLERWVVAYIYFHTTAFCRPKIPQK